MPAVVAQQGQPVAQRGAAYQQVEIADGSSSRFQSAPFAGEYAADFVIHLENIIPTYELQQEGFVSTWLIRVKHALVEFCRRNDAYTDTFTGHLLEAPNDGGIAVKGVNYPVGIYEPAHGDPALYSCLLPDSRAW